MCHKCLATIYRIWATDQIELFANQFGWLFVYLYWKSKKVFS